jgi:hypothetical protein
VAANISSVTAIELLPVLLSLEHRRQRTDTEAKQSCKLSKSRNRDPPFRTRYLQFRRSLRIHSLLPKPHPVDHPRGDGQPASTRNWKEPRAQQQYDHRHRPPLHLPVYRIDDPPHQQQQAQCIPQDVAINLAYADCQPAQCTRQRGEALNLQRDPGNPALASSAFTYTSVKFAGKVNLMRGDRLFLTSTKLRGTLSCPL